MRKSFRLTLACSAILFASQLGGMNNQNNPNSHNSQQGQPRQNANSNNPQNPRNNDAPTISPEEMNRLIDSINRFEQHSLSIQIPYNDAQGFGYPRHAGRAVDVYNANNSYSSNQPPMQIPMHFGQPPMQMPYNAGEANYYGYPQQTYQPPMQMPYNAGEANYYGYPQQTYQPPMQTPYNAYGYDYPRQTYQPPMQTPYNAYGYDYPRQTYQPQIVILPDSILMTDDEATQLWPNGLMDALLSNSSSDQVFNNTSGHINKVQE